MARLWADDCASCLIGGLCDRPPFSAAVARELNVAVYDILTLGKTVSPHPSLHDVCTSRLLI